MKRNFGPKLIAAAAVLMLLFALPAAAYAANSSVTYNGYAGSYFGFAPDSGTTGLFPDLQGLMPGGTYTQTITVSNTYNQQVNLYLRGEPISGGELDLLNQLTFEVKLDGVTIQQAGTPAAAAWPENGATTNSTAKFIYLGTFTTNASKTLTVLMTVPASLGNDYQNAQGKVKWVFQADVYVPYNPPGNPTPIPTIPLNPGITIETGGNTIPLSPGTGDNTNFLLWGAGAVVLAVGLAVLIYKRRKA